MSIERLDEVGEYVVRYADNLTEAAASLSSGRISTQADVDKFWQAFWNNYEGGQQFFGELDSLSREHQRELSKSRTDRGLGLPPRTPCGNQLSTASRAVAVLWAEVHQATELYRSNPTEDTLASIAELRFDYSALLTDLQRELEHSLRNTEQNGQGDPLSDGPDGVNFNWKGKAHRMPNGKPAALIAGLWASMPRTVDIDDVASDLSDDHAADLDENSVRGAKDKANAFFRKHGLPVKIRKVDGELKYYIEALEPDSPPDVR